MPIGLKHALVTELLEMEGLNATKEVAVVSVSAGLGRIVTSNGVPSGR